MSQYLRDRRRAAAKRKTEGREKMQDELDELQRRIENGMRASWLRRLDERQQRLVANARLYSGNDPAGMPGHQLALIIAKLADMLDEFEPVKALDKH